MINRRQYFGTDGIRGRVGKSPITADFVLKLGWAAGVVLSKNKKRPKVVIGKDTRVSGYMFESALEAGLSAAGVDVYLLGPMPTPGIAYITRSLHASAGIVISASHNPYYDNGIKFFGADGQKLADEVEFEIEKFIEEPMMTVSCELLGRATRINDAGRRYVEFCKSSLEEEISLEGLKIVIDCANGATYHVAPDVFREMGAELIEIAVDPNGININDHCGATDTKSIQRMVKAEHADIGIALDGDGDRLIMIDHTGEVVDGDEILLMIARHLKETGRLQGGVVGTVMTNFGLEVGFRELDIPFVRSQVGDRYVLEELLARHWRIGGESSGHIICLDITSTGDGIITAIQVLNVMVKTKKSLRELKLGMKKMPQILLNVKRTKEIDVHTHPEIQKALKVAEEKLQGTGRVLLRPSGTEPLIRVMAEGQDENLVKEVVESLAAMVKKHC